ncbi:MAG TPA: hypothetical protein VK171_03905 [Fimbriimonas sp.]|nr:hypothetical protein [Fimbriimonas sp.]
MLNLAKGSSVGSAVNELTDQIDRALSKGDGWEAAKLVLALLLSLIEIIEILLKRLGFSQLQILKAKLVLNYISVIFGAVNLIGATTSWLRLEGNGRATLPVDRPQNFVVVDQGKGAPAFDWTLNTAGLLIPMGEYRMSLQVGGDKAPGITKATLPLGWTAYALHVMHKLNNSVNIPNGTLVGRLIATCEGGITLRKDLIAGENTAEWAWEREDKLGNRPKHNLPSTPYAQPITDGGVNFNIRHFYTKIGTSGSDGPLRVEHLQLEMYAHPAASKLGIDIYALTIEEAKLRSRPR